MIHVAVCDDDPNVTASIHRYLKKKDEQLQTETLHISLFDSGADFLMAIEHGAIFHIVFMDIQMDGLNGIEVGQILRKRPDGDDFILIYISSHNSYFHEVVQLGTYRFIGKPIKDAELDCVFSRALTQALKYKSVITPRLFSFKFGGEVQLVRTDDIAYLKNQKRLIALYVWKHTEKSVRILSKFYSTIDEVRGQLPKEQFVQCERSYIVNLNYVQRLRKDEFVLMDECTKIPVGRTYRDEMKDIFFKYQEGSAWIRSQSK
jgi:DNA-binding LytR/AlgR family response regulator